MFASRKHVLEPDQFLANSDGKTHTLQHLAAAFSVPATSSGTVPKDLKMNIVAVLEHAYDRGTGQ